MHELKNIVTFSRGRDSEFKSPWVYHAYAVEISSTIQLKIEEAMSWVDQPPQQYSTPGGSQLSDIESIVKGGVIIPL